MKEINCKILANNIVLKLKNELNLYPKKFFAAFVIGNNLASERFLNEKKKFSEILGIDFRIYVFPNSISQDKFREKINNIVLGSSCGGAIVQLPLPPGFNTQYILNTIPKEKDVDVLGERALGAFYCGRNKILPPTVGVLKEVLHEEKKIIENENFAVVGLGNLVGKPIVSYLMGKTKNIFLFDKGSDFSLIKKASIVILGTGQSHIIDSSIISEKSVVIDFGYSINNGKITGDFNPSLNNLSSISFTPTPGGTGPLLVAKIFENFLFLISFQKKNKNKRLFYKSL